MENNSQLKLFGLSRVVLFGEKQQPASVLHPGTVSVELTRLGMCLYLVICSAQLNVMLVILCGKLRLTEGWEFVNDIGSPVDSM